MKKTGLRVPEECRKDDHEIMNDYELCELLKNSSEKAYRAVFDEYANLVYVIVINRIRNIASPEDIEDTVCDVFAEVFQSMSAFDPEQGSLKTYISIIARRKAIDAFRKLSGYSVRVMSLEDENAVIPASSDDTAAEAEKNIERKELWQKIQLLDEPDKSIITLQYFYDKTASEIGKLLNMTTSSVQKRSLRARQKLLKLIRSESGSFGGDMI